MYIEDFPANPLPITDSSTSCDEKAINYICGISVKIQNTASGESVQIHGAESLKS